MQKFFVYVQLHHKGHLVSDVAISGSEAFGLESEYNHEADSVESETRDNYIGWLTVLPRNLLLVVGTYKGHLPLSDSRWGGDSTWRW